MCSPAGRAAGLAGERRTRTVPRPQALDGYWLGEQQFVAGDEVSIADLLLGCEVEMLALLDAADQARTSLFMRPGKDLPFVCRLRLPLSCAPRSPPGMPRRVAAWEIQTQIAQEAI